MSLEHTCGSGFSTDQIMWNKSELKLLFLVLLLSINHKTHGWGCYHGLVYLFDRFVRTQHALIWTKKTFLQHNIVWEMPLINKTPPHLINIIIMSFFLFLHTVFDLYYSMTAFFTISPHCSLSKHLHNTVLTHTVSSSKICTHERKKINWVNGACVC